MLAVAQNELEEEKQAPAVEVDVNELSHEMNAMQIAKPTKEQRRRSRSVLDSLRAERGKVFESDDLSMI